MLDLYLSRSGTNDVGTELYLTDVTEWESQEQRDSYTLYLEAKLKALSGDVDITDITTVENSEEIPQTEYTLGITRDGYYEMTMAAVSNASPTDANEYGLIDGMITKLVVEYNELGEIIYAEFESKTFDEMVADEDFTDWVIFRTLVLNRVAIHTNQKYLEYFQESQKYFNDGGHYPELFRLKRELDFAKSALNGAQYTWELDNYTGAQSIIENMEVIL